MGLDTFFNSSTGSERCSAAEKLWRFNLHSFHYLVYLVELTNSWRSTSGKKTPDVRRREKSNMEFLNSELEKEVFEIMQEYDLDEDTAERVLEIVEELGIDIDEAIELEGEI